MEIMAMSKVLVATGANEKDIFYNPRRQQCRSHNLPGRGVILLIMMMSAVMFSLVVYYLLKVEGSSGNGIYLADPGSTWRSSFPPNCFLFFPPLLLEVDLSYWLVLEHVFYCFLTMMQLMIDTKLSFPFTFLCGFRLHGVSWSNFVLPHSWLALPLFSYPA